MPTIAADLRAAGRTAAFLGLTPTLLALMELERRGRSESDPILRKWLARYGTLMTRSYGLRQRASGPHLAEGRVYPGRDERGLGRIFVVNHRSMLDVFVTLRHLAGTFVARADISGWPVIGFIAGRIGTLWVDRQSRSSGSAVIRGMQEALRAGLAVTVFPEGTTFAGDAVRPFRIGAFRAAAHVGAEVVPVGLAYGEADDAYGDEGFAAHYRRAAAKARTEVAVVAGEPLLMPGAEPDALRAAAHERVQDLVHQARAMLAVGRARW